jgi:hypothetical protein
MNTPTKPPEIGFVFRKGTAEECTVIGVWESRFGDWKVSYADRHGGGGLMNLEYFTERFGHSESHCVAAGTADEKPDGQAENAGGMARELAALDSESTTDING